MTLRHAWDQTDAELDEREQRRSDAEARMWADADLLAEFLLNTPNGPLDNNEAGKEFFSTLQAWKLTPPQDERGRVALERALGRIVARAMDAYVEDVAEQGDE